MQVVPVVLRERTLLLQVINGEALCAFLDTTVRGWIGSEVGESKSCGNGKDHRLGFELWSKHAHEAIDSKPCVLKDIQFGSNSCSVFGSAQSCVKSF